MSWVFFVGDHAYKLKKPVRTAFLDFSTVEARRLDCEREVELNRRLAPDVYEGVATVTGPDGRVCDHLVVMRRMPDDRRLAALAVAGEPGGRLRRCLFDVARRLAEFHAGAARSAEIDAAGSQAAIAARWLANTAELQPFGDAVVDAAMVDEVDGLAARYVAGRGPLFEQRIAAGRVVDGHGDLLADDVFCLDDGPRILDCLEFDDGLRWGDGLADAAFLAMDLERLGRPDLATVFLAAYKGASGDSWPTSLADHHVAYRAQVRSKVACLRAEQGEDTAGQARTLLAIARDHLRRSAVRIVLVGGLPGTGKSTVAAGLGHHLGWPVLRSDVVRKELAGMPGQPAEPAYRQGLYDAASTERTYRELVARAAALTSSGRSVVLDASWTDEAHRELARAMAAGTATDVFELRCVAPASVAAGRIERRHRCTDDPSDATPAIARAMSNDAEPWPRAAVVDTSGSLDEALSDALAVVVAPPAR